MNLFQWIQVKPPGSDLFSARGDPSVSSALGRFTSVFGMGTGGATPLKPPGDYYQFTTNILKGTTRAGLRFLNINSLSLCNNFSQDQEVSFFIYSHQHPPVIVEISFKLRLTGDYNSDSSREEKRIS
jgi:hypothetical protein